MFNILYSFALINHKWLRKNFSTGTTITNRIKYVQKVIVGFIFSEGLHLAWRLSKNIQPSGLHALKILPLKIFVLKHSL